MEQKEFDALVAKVGQEAAKEIAKQMDAYKTSIEAIEKKMNEGTLSKDEFETFKKEEAERAAELKTILEKQGTSIAEVLSKIETGGVKEKSIAETLFDAQKDLQTIFSNRTGNKTFMITLGKDGKTPVMRPFDEFKAAGPHATIADVGGNGNVSSISQSIDAASLLRIAAGSEVYDRYRNTPWLFPLTNTYTTGWGTSLFTYINEQPKDGSSATVIEGGTKPPVQYKYQVNSATYKKEAMLVSFTEEFMLDFEGLHNRILNVAQIDLLNAINSKILTNVTAAATAFNQAAEWKAAGSGLTNPNDWHVIAALAAQVEKATFTNIANTALMNTFKKYRMGTEQTGLGTWLDAPTILNQISMVSNPDMEVSSVIVGDLKQYNVAMRGGIIVRVGYNGTDFAENKFSTVIEQYYFDYISDIRKPAIVKGDFETVKNAIADGSAS